MTTSQLVLVVAGLSSLLGGAPRRPSRPSAHAAERVSVNDNRTPAGTLHDGVLTLRLEVRDAEWHPDRETDPGVVVRAFAEDGKPASIPGPLVRVPQGTEIHAFVRNTLTDSTLVLRGLSADTIQVRPGQVRDVRFIATTAGTYYYSGTTAQSTPGNRATIDAELSGAFVVDPPGTAGSVNDRIFVLALWSRRPTPGGIVAATDLLRFTINGKAWPNTERLTYTEGDTARFRIINVSGAAHPMHLHGFYFDVESRGNGTRDSTFDRAGSRHMVVTERAAAGRTFTMTWVPTRSGNWMFHCHDNFHVLRNAPLDGSPLASVDMHHVTNHAMEMMGGLVMGIEVRPKNGSAVVTQGEARRKLRLIARVDSGGTDAEPNFGYVLQDGRSTSPSSAPLLPGPTILLTRGEPVSITVVNELAEPTAVHWHGIELDSYYDGVAGFAGHPGHIAPAIAPRDSFVAHFTPPRAGTFIYHPHADEVRQQQAGLSGALLVIEPNSPYDPSHDIVLLLSVPRRAADGSQVYLNGGTAPAEREIRVGERYRIRLINIHTYRPSMIARLMRDSTLVTWRAIAKDGMDLPPDQATVRPAMQQMGNGETFDFELVPTMPGVHRFTVSSAAGVQLVTMAFRVR
jgi:FtsP/CotA-like multicopper oxidase with cupredoxin domain